MSVNIRVGAVSSGVPAVGMRHSAQHSICFAIFKREHHQLSRACMARNGYLAAVTRGNRKELVMAEDDAEKRQQTPKRRSARTNCAAFRVDSYRQVKMADQRAALSR